MTHCTQLPQQRKAVAEKCIHDQQSLRPRLRIRSPPLLPLSSVALPSRFPLPLSSGRNPSRNRIWCILTLTYDIWYSGGNDSNDFPENQLTKFRSRSGSATFSRKHPARARQWSGRPCAQPRLGGRRIVYHTERRFTAVDTRGKASVKPAQVDRQAAAIDRLFNLPAHFSFLFLIQDVTGSGRQNSSVST